MNQNETGLVFAPTSTALRPEARASGRQLAKPLAVPHAFASSSSIVTPNGVAIRARGSAAGKALESGSLTFSLATPSDGVQRAAVPEKTTTSPPTLKGARKEGSRKKQRSRTLQQDDAPPRRSTSALASSSSEPSDSGHSEGWPTFDDPESEEAGYDALEPSHSMQVSDLLKASPLTTPGGRAQLEDRIDALAKSGVKMATGSGLSGVGTGTGSTGTRGAAELDAGDHARVRAAFSNDELSSEELRDAVSTALMDGFRKHTGRGTFGLLYELNAAHLLVQVAGRLRRYSSKADAGDVLQEVFFNVYRYPHRFDSSRDDAFRVWTAMIVRNTVLKHLRSRSTGGGNRREIPFEDLSDQPVAHGETPLSGVLQDEANLECSRAYVTYLQLYIEFYTMLSERERHALHLVEVDGVSYREAAAALGIKLENLKMVIFRARKKIHRAMRRVFDGLSPDCKPARVGRTGSSEMPSFNLDSHS